MSDSNCWQWFHVLYSEKTILGSLTVVYLPLDDGLCFPKILLVLCEAFLESIEKLLTIDVRLEPVELLAAPIRFLRMHSVWPALPAKQYWESWPAWNGRRRHLQQGSPCDVPRPDGTLVLRFYFRRIVVPAIETV